MNHTIIVNEPTTNGQRHIGVVFDDGTPEGVRTDYSVSTVEDLKRRLVADSDRLDAVAELAKVPVDAPVDTTPIVIPPTQFEIDKAAYFKQVAVLAQYKQVFKDADPTLIAQEALVKTLFLPEYYA